MNSGKHRRQLRTKTHVTLSLRRGEIARRRSSAAARSLFIRYHLSSYRLIVFQPFKGGDSPPSRFFLRQGCTLRGAGGQGGCNLSSYLPISLFSIVLSTLLLVACGRERETRSMSLAFAERLARWLCELCNLGLLHWWWRYFWHTRASPRRLFPLELPSWNIPFEKLLRLRAPTKVSSKLVSRLREYEKWSKKQTTERERERERVCAQIFNKNRNEKLLDYHDTGGPRLSYLLASWNMCTKVEQRRKENIKKCFFTIFIF